MESDLPRERLLRFGVDALSVKELVCILLGSGVQGNNVQHIAEELLKQDLRTISVRQLQQVRGIGVARACKIVAAVSLSRRLLSGETERVVLSSPEQVFSFMRYLQAYDQEHFFGLYVDARKQLLAKHLLFKGTADATTVHPRDIFRKAIEENASGIIIVHNHPSGQCDPSEEDLLFTQRLIKVGKLLHMPLLDHVIVGEKYWSFLERG